MLCIESSPSSSPIISCKRIINDTCHRKCPKNILNIIHTLFCEDSEQQCKSIQALKENDIFLEEIILERIIEIGETYDFEIELVVISFFKKYLKNQHVPHGIQSSLLNLLRFYISQIEFEPIIFSKVVRLLTKLCSQSSDFEQEIVKDGFIGHCKTACHTAANDLVTYLNSDMIAEATEIEVFISEILEFLFSHPYNIDLEISQIFNVFFTSQVPKNHMLTLYLLAFDNMYEWIKKSPISFPVSLFSRSFFDSFRVCVFSSVSEAIECVLFIANEAILIYPQFVDEFLDNGLFELLEMSSSLQKSSMYLLTSFISKVSQLDDFFNHPFLTEEKTVKFLQIVFQNESFPVYSQAFPYINYLARSYDIDKVTLLFRNFIPELFTFDSILEINDSVISIPAIKSLHMLLEFMIANQYPLNQVITEKTAHLLGENIFDSYENEMIVNSILEAIP